MPGLRVVETENEEVEIALHRDNANNIDNTEVFNDIDGNPASDSGVPLPADNLLSKTDAINHIFNSIDGKYIKHFKKSKLNLFIVNILYNSR